MSSLKLYHVSEQQIHNKMLYPRVPDNYMTNIGAEENKTHRVCFAETIDGALAALGQNIEGKKFYVYTADITDQVVVSNHTIIQKGYVPDGRHTKETWVLDPVRIKLDCMIKVGEADRPLPYKYKEGSKEYKAELWSWKYTKVRIPRSLMLNK